MADESHPTTKALVLQAAPLSKTTPALNKTITESATTADMPGQPETPQSPEQNCPFFKLSTELRREICRFAIQQALDLVNPAPGTNHRYSTTQTTRGALALLYTCHTLRTESIDAMEPVAKASRVSLQSEIHLAHCRAIAAMESSGDPFPNLMTYIGLGSESMRLESNLTEVDEVLSVLAFAREADEKMRAGGETDRAQLGSRRGKRSKQAITENGQLVVWGGA